MKEKTTTIGKAKSFALISFLAPSLALATGVADLADYDSRDAAITALETPTLGTDASYTLEALEDGKTAAFEITKYLKSTTDGKVSLEEVALSLDVKSLDLSTEGNEDTATIYYKWSDTDNKTLTVVTDTGSLTEGTDYDFSVTYDNSSNNIKSAQTYITEDSTGITYNYVKSTDYSYGAGIYNNNSTISYIAGDFIANEATSWAGAIFNWGGIIGTNDDNAENNGITGNFIGNNAKTTTTGTSSSYITVYGGAIYNSGSIYGGISGDFIANYASGTGNYNLVYGGAIYNKGTIYDGLTSNFIGNYAYSTEAIAYSLGGAIYNSGTIGTVTTEEDGTYTYSDGIVGDFIGNYTTSAFNAWGGAIYNKGTIGNINGDFIANYAISSSTIKAINARGGAIYNDTTGVINDIAGDFIGNYAIASAEDTVNASYAAGGAIYNAGTITAIYGDFINNYVESLYTVEKAKVYTLGGAIYNQGTITAIYGDFINNSASQYFVAGGAIYNVGTIGEITEKEDGTYTYYDGIVGDFTQNSIVTTANFNAQAQGGAIYNAGTISSLVGDFTGNYIESASSASYGGAIYNITLSSNTANAYIGLIEGDFTDNYNYSNSSRAHGGAISNNVDDEYTGDYSSIIDIIKGDFTNNYASANNSSSFINAWGGAIDNGNASIGSIEGDFSSNYAYSTHTEENRIYGGAINNIDSNIVSIEGDFTSNYGSATASGNEDTKVRGGAIANWKSSGADDFSEIESIEGDFTSNYVYASSGNAQGGAIYNNAIIGYIEGAFEGNYAVGADGVNTQGGAIYTSGVYSGDNSAAGTITLTATDGNEIVNVGNFATTNATITVADNGAVTFESLTLTEDDDANGGFLYIDGAATVNFDTDADSSITIGDGTVGYDSIASSDATAVITKTGAGTLTVNSSMAYYYGELNIDEGTMEYTNSAALGAAVLNIGDSLTSTEKDEEDNEVTTGYATFVANASSLSADTAVTLNSDGTLSLTGGTLSAAINNYETLTGTISATDTTIAAAVYATNVGLTGSTVNAAIEATDISIAGTVSVNNDAEDETKNGALTASNITVAEAASLTSNASNLSATNGISNAGTITLTGGELDSEIATAEGATEDSVVITDYVYVDAGSIKASSISITDAEDAALTSSASNLNATNGISNAGDLILTGGELTSTVSGTGDVTASNTTISATIAAGNVGLSNSSVNAEVSATEINIVTGSVTVNNDSEDETKNGSLTADSIGIATDATLTANASNLNTTEISNAGTLALTGGELDFAVSSAEVVGEVVASDSVVITSDSLVEVTTGSIEATSISIEQDATLISNADNLDASINIVEEGTLALTGGELDSAVTGSGDVTISNDVTVKDEAGSIDASSIYISTDASLESNASSLNASIGIAADGELILTGGELSSVVNSSDDLTGKVSITGEVSVNDESGAIYANTLNIAEDGTLTIVEGSLGIITLVNDGTLNITEGELSSDVSITNNSNMTVDLDSLNGNNILNQGTLTLNAGTLSSAIVGTGTVKIADYVAISGGAITASIISIADEAVLKSNAYNFYASEGISIDTLGTLALTGGELTSEVSGTGYFTADGETTISAEVSVTNVGLSNSTVNAEVSAADITIVSGTVSVTDDGSLNATSTIGIATDATLTSNASNLSATNGINNEGTLALTGGELDSAVSGGSVEISGYVAVDAGSIKSTSISIADEAVLESNASNLEAINGISIVDEGTLALTGGELNSTVSDNGTGYFTADGDTTISAEVSVTNVGLSNSTVNAEVSATDITIVSGTVSVTDENGTLTASNSIAIATDATLSSNASNLDAANGISNAGTITLTGGELDSTLTNESTGIVNTSADSLGNNNSITNDGIVNLSTGTLSNEISGDGTIAIAANNAVSSDVSLLGNTVENGGSLYLTGNTLTSDITNPEDGNGAVYATDITVASSVSSSYITIIGDVSVDNDEETTYGSLSATNTITIDEDSSLTSNASNLDAGSISNTGTLTLSGGELTSAVSGEGDVIASETTLEGAISATNLTLTDDSTANGTITATDVTLTDSTANGSITATDVDLSGTTTVAGDVNATTMNVDGNIDVAANVTAAIVITDTSDFDVIITTENAGTTILDGNISYVDSEGETSGNTLNIDISFDDIFSVLNTTTTIYNAEVVTSGTTIELDYGNYTGDYYDGITISDDNFIIEVGDTILLKQSTTDEETGETTTATAEFTTDDDSNDIINVEGNFVLDEGVQSADIVYTTTTTTDAETGETTTTNVGSLEIGTDSTLNAGTLSEDSSLSVTGGEANLDTTQAGSTVTVTSGSTSIGTVDSGSTVEVSDGTASVENLAGTVDVSGGEANLDTTQAGSSVTVTGGDTSIGTVDSGSTVEVSDGTASVESLAGTVDVSGGETTIDTAESTASVDVSGGSATITTVATDEETGESASISVSGGDLSLGDAESSFTTTVAILNKEGEADADEATKVGATSGSLSILSSTEDCNILLTGGEYEIDGDLALNTTSENVESSTTSVIATGDNTVGTTDDVKQAALTINSALTISEGASLTTNTDLVLQEGASLADGAKLTVNSSLSATDEDTTETKIAGTSGNSETLVLGNDDNNTLSLNTTVVAENVANLDLNGDIDANQNTAIKLSGDEATITGTVSIDAKTAIEVANTGGNVTLDNATITSSGIALSNSIDGTEGLNVTAKGQSKVSSLKANSPFSLTGSNMSDTDYSLVSGDYTTYGDTLTVTGTITTGDSASDDSVTITGATLVLDGAYLSTSYEDEPAGDLIIQDNGALIADAATIIVGDISVDDTSSLYLDNGSALTATSIYLEAGSTLSLTNYSYITGDCTISGAGSISVEISGTAAMLVGDTFQVTDASVDLDGVYVNVVGANDNVQYSLLSTSDGVTLEIDALTHFQEKYADASSNVKTLALALDNINADGEVAGDEIYDAKSEFKTDMYNDNLDSYIMNSTSYMNEVDTLLLNNMNLANTKRARTLLNNVEASIDNSNVSKKNAKNNTTESYPLVAQLQSINLLGSKSGDKNIAGYNYWSVGSTANIDSKLSDNALVGLSIGGAYSKVEGDAGDNANSTAFLINAYAVLKMDSIPLEFFANIGYAHFWNEANKVGVASADWDSDAFNCLVGTALNIETGTEGLTISPLAMLNMVLLNSGSASYSNGVKIDSESYMSAKLMLGLELERRFTKQFAASLRAMYAYEFADERFDMTYGASNGFVNGLEFIGGENGRNSFIVGAGVSYDFSESCVGYFDYVAYIYERLATHSLNLSVAVKF